MATLTGASERVGRLLCATLFAVVSMSVASGPLSSRDIVRAEPNVGLLSLYSTCTQSVADQVCAGRPNARVVEQLLSDHFKVFDPLHRQAKSEWLVSVVTPSLFPGPLQEGVALGPDGLLLAGYVINAKLHRLREEQRY